ncbi:MAG TPA: hypothetical protein VFF96_02290, partial [Pseudoxanthomonas sp.]|nr:hypothetical protein [Pseudoxanthomonas sp.]
MRKLMIIGVATTSLMFAALASAQQAGTHVGAGANVQAGAVDAQAQTGANAGMHSDAVQSAVQSARDSGEQAGTTVRDAAR